MLRCSERVLFETVTVAVVLIAALIVGLITAGDYGATIDEFNTNDYGPKALAWYTSGFTDRRSLKPRIFALVLRPLVSDGHGCSAIARAC